MKFPIYLFTLILLATMGGAGAAVDDPQACPAGYMALARVQVEDHPVLLARESAALDAELAGQIYPGGDPGSLLPAHQRNRALPLFDRLDVYNAMQFLGGRGLSLASLTSSQRRFLSDVLQRRGYGRYDWGQWDEVSRELTDLDLGISASDVDRAVAHATSLDVRPGIRVVPASRPGSKDYVNPEFVPNGPTLIIPSNPDVQGDGVGKTVAESVRRLLTRDGNTAPGMVLLADLHVGRAGGEEANFRAMVRELARNPPSRILIGGDLIDAPAFARFVDRLNGILEDSSAVSAALKRAELSETERILFDKMVALRSKLNKEGKLSPAEVRYLRRMRFEELLGYLREHLPHRDEKGNVLTEIVFQFGNHDLTRHAQLPRKVGTPVKRFGVELDRMDTPPIPLDRRGRLPEGWHEKFRADFAEVLEKKLKGDELGSALATLKGYSPTEVLGLAREFYAIKGQASKFQELSHFPYYSESEGRALAGMLGKLDVGVTGLRSDQYFHLDLADGSQLLFAHEPQENGANINRIYAEKPAVSGGQTRFPRSARAVVAFDQHSAGTIIMDVDGRPVSVHMVGSLTPNSNAGQRLMAAVVDPATGNLFHITFDNGEGQVGPPRRADYRQLQYVRPTLDDNRPDSVAPNTANMGG